MIYTKNEILLPSLILNSYFICHTKKIFIGVRWALSGSLPCTLLLTITFYLFYFYVFILFPWKFIYYRVILSIVVFLKYFSRNQIWTNLDENLGKCCYWWEFSFPEIFLSKSRSRVGHRTKTLRPQNFKNFGNLTKIRNLA